MDTPNWHTYAHTSTSTQPRAHVEVGAHTQTYLNIILGLKY